MDPRTAAHVLGQIAAHLELRGESTFKSRAYEQAAAALLGVDTDDLGPLYRSGELARTRGLGPATLSVVRDLIETGESSYLEQLRATTPSGLLDLLRVPGLGTARIHKLHEALGVDSIESLEQAARDGRLASLPRYGPKTAEKILRGIQLFRAAGTQRLYPYGAEEGARVLAMVRGHPDVLAAGLAGSIRRRRETVGDVDVVAACGGNPERVATSFANAPGVRSARVTGVASVAITYVDGTCIDLHCVAREDFAIALWRATGSTDHLDAVAARLAERGFALQDDRLLDERHAVVPIADEAALYQHAGLAFVPPELREGRGEIEAAAAGRLPTLLEPDDIRGVLHCHSTWSDGKATIAQMADAARERLELHRDHRPLAVRLLRQRHVARARARAARRDRRAERGTRRRARAERRGGRHPRRRHARLRRRPARPVRLRGRLRALAVRDGSRGDDGARAARARRSSAHDPRPPDRSAAAVPRAVPHRRRRGAGEGGRGGRRGGAQRRPAPPRSRLAPPPARPRTRRADRDRPRCPLTQRTGSHDDGNRHRAQGRTDRARRAEHAVRGRRARVRAGAPRAGSALMAAKPTSRPKRPRPRGPALRAHAALVLDRLFERYPDAHCALDFTNAFELLCATILSAQCTDKRVNIVTPALFARYPDARALGGARQEDVEGIVKSTGFFRNKAKSLIAMALARVERHGGEVPRTMEELVVLPGVGRKTANVILGNAYGINEGVTVDTHVQRIAGRLGLTRETDPVKVEQALMPLFPRERWGMLSHLLIFH